MSVDRETVVTIMAQTYGSRGLASMALDRAETIEQLKQQLVEYVPAAVCEARVQDAADKSYKLGFHAGESAARAEQSS